MYGTYGNRRTVRRRRTGVAKKALWKKPTARNQRSQIYSNAKSIGRLYKRWSSMSVRHTYTEGDLINLYDTDGSGVAYQVIKLTNPLTWKAIFATTNTQGETSKTLLTRIAMSMRFQVHSQPAPVVYNLFVVSLKRSAATLDIAQLQNGTHYETGSAATLQGNVNVFLSPKVFRIHKWRKFTLARNPESSSQPTPPGTGFPPCSWKDIKCTLYPKTTLKSYDGDWKTLEELDLPATQRKYVLIFYNNSYATGSFNTVTYNNIYNCTNMY